MKRSLLLLCFCTTLIFISNAQTEDKKWNIGLHAGLTQYEGDLGNDFYQTNEGVFPFGALSVSRYINDYLDLSLLGTKGIVGSKHIDPITNERFKDDLSTLTLNARFNILGSKHAVRPYLFVGWGIMYFDKNLTTNKSHIDYAAPSFGAGISLKLSPSVMFNLQEMFIYSTGDSRDGKIGGGNDAYVFHTAGLTFNFGSKKDADKDGVADHLDKCPNTPFGITVDKYGCPIDRDNDGTPDYLDSCPYVAGTKLLHGCPDTDGDGIPDIDDRCPTRPGSALLKGCPDSDGDGIPDIDDRCPTLPGSAVLKGCPDSDSDGVADIDDRCPDTKKGYKVDSFGCPLDDDKDGIVNEEDRCPEQAGPVIFKGCPDTDGDGIPDIDDRCPTVPGPKANHGCPEIKKEDVTKIEQIASKIFFETKSDELKPSSKVQLDVLATILQRNAATNLVIEGFTDNTGTDEVNMILSQKRADAVKKYLIGKSIAESRLTATGFGKANPIADNKTEAGRAKNRRISLISY